MAAGWVCAFVRDIKPLMSRPVLGIYADDAAEAAQTQASTNFASVSELQTEVLRLDQLLLGKETEIN